MSGNIDGSNRLGDKRVLNMSGRSCYYLWYYYLSDLPGVRRK
jgi:hypothetical protein